MAPIKFEENLKTKLEQRTINPSAKSWGTLATQLDTKEQKKGNNTKLWLGIAATLLGVLLAYTMFFNTNNSNVPAEIIVETNTEIEEGKEQKEELNTTKEVIAVTEKETPIIEEKIFKKAPIKTENAQIKREYIAKAKSNKNEPKTEAIQNEPKSNAIYYASNGIEKKDVNQVKQPIEIIVENTVVVAQNEALEITDKELDELLKNAESKIANTNNTTPLDYNELLQDVEDDLEETFRDKLLKTVKGSYRSVKTYVAERNE